jgi:hypothetical protein
VGLKPVWTMRKREEYLALTGIEPQFLGRPARSPLLYRLSHPGSIAEYYFDIQASMQAITEAAGSIQQFGNFAKL